MRGIDSCEKCDHYHVCKWRDNMEAFYSTSTKVRMMKQGSDMWRSLLRLLADNCKYYNDKGGDKGGE